ncbi:hypothetical protein EK599_03045 [Vibrio sp. T187]|uniref:hypothetical protein n=1 Tax=Vibrio TaxID=662 RepID=UPI0010C9AE2A|nr:MULTISPECIES: hypothetical protein [Vibrio]MBW3694653.1 hypothetical protein [Vibrio sp. T187]
MRQGYPLSINKLASSQRYTAEAMCAAQDVVNINTKIYTRWLVSERYLVAPNEPSSSHLPGYGENAILDEKDRVNAHQRILLGCEKSKVIDRVESLKKEQVQLEDIKEEIQAEIIKALIKDIRSNQAVGSICDTDKLSELMELLTHPHVDSEAMVSFAIRNHSIDFGLKKYMKRYFDSRAIEGGHPSSRTAIGHLGIERCRDIFPTILIRSRFDKGSELHKFVYRKLWHQVELMSNSISSRLECAEVDDKVVSSLFAILYTLPSFVIVEKYSQFYDEVYAKKLYEYRSLKDATKYNMCLTLKPTLCPASVIYKFEKVVRKQLLSSLKFGSHLEPMKVAFLEDLKNQPIIDRSLFGMALAQGKAYTMWRVLEGYKLTKKNHKPLWFGFFQMDKTALSSINERFPTR